MKKFYWALGLIVLSTSIDGMNIGPGEEGKSIAYKRLSVPFSVMNREGVSVQNVTTSTKTPCAFEANRCFLCHLFCYKKETEVCSLYDVRLPANYEAEEDDDPKTLCYTNVPEGCFGDNLTLLEGETVIEGYFNMTCVNRVFTKKLDCRSSGDLGCLILVLTTMSWEDSKKECEQLGMRLLEDIPSRQHFRLIWNAFNNEGSLWVGARGRKWITSEEEINTDLYHSGEPNDGTDACIALDSDASAGASEGLLDVSCTGARYGICQLLPSQ